MAISGLVDALYLCKVNKFILPIEMLYASVGAMLRFLKNCNNNFTKNIPTADHD